MVALPARPGRMRENLFLRTVLVVAVGIILVGGAVTYLLVRLWVEPAVQRKAAHDVEETAVPRMLRLVSPPDLALPLTGERYEALDKGVHSWVLDPNIVRVKVWKVDGMVAYSTLSSEVGTLLPGHQPFREALAGRAVWGVHRQTESPLPPELGPVLESYIPLAWESKGAPAAVLEVYQRYQGYADFVGTIKAGIFAAVGVTALTLPVALYLLYRTGWREVRRERDVAVQREREVSALNRLLQRDIAHSLELRDRLRDLRDEMARLPVSPGDPATMAARYAYLGTQIGELVAHAEDLLSVSSETRPASG